jgi:hypothetical protein
VKKEGRKEGREGGRKEGRKDCEGRAWKRRNMNVKSNDVVG